MNYRYILETYLLAGICDTGRAYIVLWVIDEQILKPNDILWKNSTNEQSRRDSFDAPIRLDLLRGCLRRDIATRNVSLRLDTDDNAVRISCNLEITYSYTRHGKTFIHAG